MTDIWDTARLQEIASYGNSHPEWLANMLGATGGMTAAVPAMIDDVRGLLDKGWPPWVVTVYLYELIPQYMPEEEAGFMLAAGLIVAQTIDTQAREVLEDDKD